MANFFSKSNNRLPKLVKTLAAVATLLFISTICLYDSSPLISGPGYDKAVFRYIATVVRLGGTPYLDAFDHKPPLLFLLAAPFTSFGAMGFWIFFVLTLALSMFSNIYGAGRNSYLSIFIANITFLNFLTNPVFLEGGGLTRQVTACLSMVYYLLIYRTILSNESQARVFVALGALVSGVFFIQQNELLPMLLPLFIAIIFHEKNSTNHEIKPFDAASTLITSNRKTLFKKLVYSTLGAAFVASFTVGFFAIKGGDHALKELFNQAFLVNSKIYVPHGQSIAIFIESTSRIYKQIKSEGYHLILFLPFISLFATLLRAKPKNRCKLLIIHVSLFLAFVTQIFSTSLSGRFFGHYYLPFSAHLGAITFVYIQTIINLRDSTPTMIQPALVKLTLGALLTLILLKHDNLIGFYHRIKNNLVMFNFHHFKELSPTEVEKIVSEVAGIKGQFFSFGNVTHLTVNSNLNIVAPTKFIYNHFWFSEKFKEMFGKPESIIEDLHANKTRYILDCSDHKGLYINEEFDKNWQTFISKNYREIKSSYGCSLQKRID